MSGCVYTASTRHLAVRLWRKRSTNRKSYCMGPLIARRMTLTPPCESKAWGWLYWITLHSKLAIREGIPLSQAVSQWPNWAEELWNPTLPFAISHCAPNYSAYTMYCILAYNLALLALDQVHSGIILNSRLLQFLGWPLLHPWVCSHHAATAFPKPFHGCWNIHQPAYINI